MSTSPNPVHAQWPSIKGDIKKSWSKITDSDLEKTNGDMKQIKALLQKNYGNSNESYTTKLTDIFHRSDVSHSADLKKAAVAAVDPVKTSLKT